MRVLATVLVECIIVTGKKLHNWVIKKYHDYKLSYISNLAERRRQREQAMRESLKVEETIETAVNDVVHASTPASEKDKLDAMLSLKPDYGEQDG